MSRVSHATYPPLDVLKPVADGLWIVDSGPLRALGIPLPVRMTIIRLGDGTDESHTRAQGAIDHLWAFTGEMFAVDEGERALIHAGVAIDPGALRGRWLTTLSDVVDEATLSIPQNDWMQEGGRAGRHSEHLGHLLSELQSMQRSFPGLTW